MSVLTESDVRRMIANGDLLQKKELFIPRKQIITPSAKAYLTEKNITIRYNEEKAATIKQEELATNKDDQTKEAKNQEIVFDTLFGAKLSEKPEHMTHLRGNVLVFKDHPRIAFRGAIDSLESEIIVTQIIADKLNQPKIIEDLEEIIKFIRQLIRAEVSGEPLGEFRLQNLDAKALREHSHHPSKYYGMKHFLPTYKQGEMVAYLNKLRTLTRATELVAYKAFTNEYGQTDREDIIRALNRLSSLFWIMMFKYLTDKYK